MPSATCPRCGFHSVLFRCNVCGDVRCNGNTTLKDRGACGTSKAPEPGRAAGQGKRCWVCKKGKYVKL